jgi:glutamyl-tRNA synthetase
LLLKPDGNGKLSKRDGDRLGFPVFPLRWEDPKTGEISSGYKQSGYYPEAFINMLALLGWNPGTEQEIFSMDELIEAFSLEHCNKSGARFNVEKTKWFNHEYLMHKSSEEVGAEYAEWLKTEKGIVADQLYVNEVTALVKESTL